MITELITASLKMEGELFKLGKKIDSEKDLNVFVKLKKEEYELQVRHRQYMILIDDHRKNEAIKSAKRRGMK